MNHDNLTLVECSASCDDNCLRLKIEFASSDGNNPKDPLSFRIDSVADYTPEDFSKALRDMASTVEKYCESGVNWSMGAL